MDIAELLIELFDRIPELVDRAVDDLTPAQLTTAPAEGANTIGWLVWHLARVEDSHVADLLDGHQLWEDDGWAARFGLDPDPGNTGYGHDADEVAQVRPESAEALVDYYGAVHERTLGYLRGLSAADLDAVVDRRWDPPVTLGVRLVSIADDCIQHAGQAAYARGLITT